MAAKNRLDPTVRNTFNCALLNGSYQALGVGFASDLAIYKVYNSSANDVDVSFDGIDDHDVIPGNGTFILDVQANKEGDRAAWPAGRVMYVKGTAAAGTIYEMGYTLKRA